MKQKWNITLSDFNEFVALLRQAKFDVNIKKRPNYQTHLVLL